MGQTNIIPMPYVSHSTNFYGNDAKYYYGSITDTYDGNLSTYQGIRNAAYGQGHEPNYCYMDNYHTWVTPLFVSSVRAKMYSENNAHSGNYTNRGVTPLIQQLIYVRISGVWTNVWGYTINNPGGDSAPSYSIPQDVAINGNWSNVTGVRVYAAANSYTYEGQRQSDTYNYIYEVQAFAQVYGDIGLKFKTATGTETIGVDPVTPNHSLRICKNGTVYGIALLPTNDINAGSFRVNKGGVIYALPKY
jgi:hypothetical protein